MVSKRDLFELIQTLSSDLDDLEYQVKALDKKVKKLEAKPKCSAPDAPKRGRGRPRKA